MFLAKFLGYVFEVFWDVFRKLFGGECLGNAREYSGSCKAGCLRALLVSLLSLVMRCGWEISGRFLVNLCFFFTRAVYTLSRCLCPSARQLGGVGELPLVIPVFRNVLPPEEKWQVGDNRAMWHAFL